MPDSADRLLKFSPIGAGGHSCWHIYYGQYYVGKILGSAGTWRVLHLDFALGDFAELEEAKRAVAEWYYGPGC